MEEISTTKGIFGKEKKKDSWSRSVKVNDITKEINVRETDNNTYIIKLTAWGDFPKEDGDGKEYKHLEKEYTSSKNPLATEDDSFKKSMDAIEELVSSSVEFNNID